MDCHFEVGQKKYEFHELLSGWKSKETENFQGLWKVIGRDLFPTVYLRNEDTVFFFDVTSGSKQELHRN